MMKGDTNLTFFLQPEGGPKSPHDTKSGMGQGDVCMVSHLYLFSIIVKPYNQLINDEFDDQVSYQPSMRAAVNVGRDVYRECSVLRPDGEAAWLVRIDSNGCSDESQPVEKKVRSDQLRPFIPPWHSNRDNRIGFERKIQLVPIC